MKEQGQGRDGDKQTHLRLVQLYKELNYLSQGAGNHVGHVSPLTQINGFLW